MNSPSDTADRERWNRIYSAGSHLSLEPDSFFAESYAEHLATRFEATPYPVALDIAGGVGRHALWLAARGWRVVLNDLSEDAARIAGENARQASLPLTIRNETAAETLAWAREEKLRFDLILVLFFLDRALFPALQAALAPGGVLMIKTRTEDHPRFAEGSQHPEYFLRGGELAKAFPGLHILQSREQGGMAELLAQAP